VKNLTTSIVAFILLSFSSVNVYVYAGVDDKEKFVVKELLEVSGAKDVYYQIIKNAEKSSKQLYRKGINQLISMTIPGKLPQETLSVIDEMIDESYDDLIKNIKSYRENIMPWDYLVNEVYVPAYLEYFSVEEMEHAIDFYKSPVGSKLVKNTPPIMNSVSMKLKKYQHDIIEYSIKAERSSVLMFSFKLASYCKQNKEKC